MFKRLLSALLVLVMVLTILPVGAFAEEADSDPSPEASTEASEGALPADNGVEPAARFPQVTWHANYPDGTDATQSMNYLGSINLANEKTRYSYAGYKISGWNTKQDGTGTFYGSDETLTPAGDMELWAQWVVNDNPTYDKKPAKPSLALVGSSKMYVYGDVITNSMQPTKAKVSVLSDKITIGEVEGSDETGYSCTISFTIASGDPLEKIISDALNENENVYGGYEDGNWTYNFEKTGTTLSFTIYNKLGTNKWWGSAAALANASATDLKSSAANQIKIYMNKPVNTYTVTYTDGVEDAEIFADQVYTVEPGAATPAFEGTPVREGYEFTGWTPEVAETVTGNVTYTATWAETPENVTLSLHIDCTCERHPTHSTGLSNVCMSKVTVYADGVEVGSLVAGGGLANKSFTIPYGAEVKLVAKPNTMSVKIETVFNGFFAGEELMSGELEYTVPAMKADSDITAVFTMAKQYYITFDGNGGKTSANNQKSFKSDDAYTPGEEVVLKNAYPSRKTFKHDLSKDYSTAYRQIGWSTDPNATTAEYGMDASIVMPDKDITLYAVWEAYEWRHWNFVVTEGGTINYKNVTGSTGFKCYAGSDGKFLAGVYPPIEAIPNEGYSFVGWYIGEEVFEAEAKIAGTTSALRNKFGQLTAAEPVVTITAVFKANEYTVSFDANGCPGTYESITVTYGEKYGDLPVAEKVDGIRNDGWFILGENGELTGGRKGILASTTVSTAGDHVLFQKRAIIPPNVKIKLTNDGDMGDDYGYYNGATRTLTVEFTGNLNEEILNYSYQWYKDGEAIEGATEKVLVLDGNVSDSGTYKCAVTATLKDGVEIVVTEPSATREASVKVTIRRLANTYTYDFNGNGQDSTSAYTNGTTFTVTTTVPTWEGYTFAGWNTAADGTGTAYAAGDTFTFEGDKGNGGEKVTLYAQWTANEYTVTFNPNGCPGTYEPITVTFGEKYGDLPVAEKVNGIRNDGWFLVDETGAPVGREVKKSTTVSTAADHVLFQKRAIIPPNVKIKLTNDGDMGDNYGYYNGATRTLTVEFTGNLNEEILNYSYQWYKDGEAIEGATEKVLVLDGNVSDTGTYKCAVTATLKDGVEIVVTEPSATREASVKVTIRRLANTYTYDFNGNGQDSTSAYTNGTTFTVTTTVPTWEGYTFAGWNTAADGTGTAYAAGDTFTFEGDKGNGGEKVTLYAQWTVNTYTVTFDSNGGSEVEPITVTYGQPVGELPVPEKTGYTLVGWLDPDGKTVTAETVYTETSDVVYTAQWKASTYTISFNSNGGSKCKDIKVTYGEEIGKLPTPTKENRTFIGWYTEDGIRVTEKTIYEVPGNTTLYAWWHAQNTSPKTGDSNIVLWASMMMLLSAAGLTVVIGKKKFFKA